MTDVRTLFVPRLICYTICYFSSKFATKEQIAKTEQIRPVCSEGSKCESEQIVICSKICSFSANFLTARKPLV